MKNYIILTILVFFVLPKVFGQNEKLGNCDPKDDLEVCKENEYTPANIDGDDIEVLKSLFNNNLPVDLICNEIKQKRLIFKFIVNSNGMVSKVDLHRSSGCKLLDKEIIRILRLVPFDPGKCGEQPICSFYSKVVDLDDIMDLPK